MYNGKKLFFVCNLLLISFHCQHVFVLRHQQPAPAVSVGLESAQPDYSGWTSLLPSEPQTLHVRDPQDVGKNGQKWEAGAG